MPINGCPTVRIGTSQQMFEFLFVVALFLPAAWRIALGMCGSSVQLTWTHANLFIIPLAVVGIVYCMFAYSWGPYGLGIPVTMAIFWLPQIAIIGFFATCEREDAAQDEAMQEQKTPE